jgi:plastocyanin
MISRLLLVVLLSALAVVPPIVSAKGDSSEVTLSARVKVTDMQQKESPQAGNVVVWLSPLDPNTPARPFSAAPLRLVQRNKSFEPHVLIIPVGAVVEFPNHDPFFHNVFSLFEGKRFDLGLYEAGTTRKVSFDRPGISYIFCNIHAEMSAVVVALDTPYYGLSNRNGEIVVPQVPIGRYTMNVWYETALPATLKSMAREINVTPETSTLGIIDIPAGPVVNAHKNKYGMDYEPPSPDTPGYTRP